MSHGADPYKRDKEQGQLEAVATTVTFVGHIVPGLAAADYATQGDWAEAGISLVGDVGMVLSGPGAAVAKGARFARTAKALRIGGTVLQGVEGLGRGEIGGNRGTQYLMW